MSDTEDDKIYNGYYASNSSLLKLETTFKNGLKQFLDMISKERQFFNGDISTEDLYCEFVASHFVEKKEEKLKKRDESININKTMRNLKLVNSEVPDENKCWALIYKKKKLRQCQCIPQKDDYYCLSHGKLDVLPYGSVVFPEDSDDSDDS